MTEKRLLTLEERVNALYEKELSRTLTESRLIEEIIRLEKIEVEFNRMIQWVKNNSIELKKLSEEIDSITTSKISFCASQIASIDIIDAVIYNLQYAKDRIND